MTDEQREQDQGKNRIRVPGFGSIYRRHKTWWLHYSAHGRTVRESSGSAHEKDALRLLKRRVGEIAKGTFAPDADRLRVGDLFTMLVNDYRAKGNRGLPPLNHLCEFFDVAVTKGDDGRITYSGGWKASTVSTDVVRRFEADQLDRAKRATVNKDLAALRRAFRLALEANRLATMPVIKTPPPDNARKGFFEPDQLAALLPHLPEYLRPVARFAYLTGWRVPSEVLTRQWRHVDLDAGVVRLEPGETKNRRGRTFPVGALPELKALLEEQRARTSALAELTGEDIPWVFHRQGSRISRNTLSSAWRAACVKAGLQGRIPHDLRRTAVRNLERAGVSRSVAMKLTGHETETVYARYAITCEADLREGVEKLATLHASLHNSGTTDGGDGS